MEAVRRNRAQQPFTRAERPALFVADRVVIAPAFRPDVLVPRQLPAEQGLAVASGLLSLLAATPDGLHFPEEMAAPGSVAVPWVHNSRTSLWIPFEADYEDRFASSMPIKVTIGPDDVFAGISAERLTSAAWAVLRLSDPEFVAFVAAQLSVAQETAPMHGHLVDIVEAMPFPDPARAKLRREAAHAERIFDQRILRQAICESAAGDAANTWALDAIDGEDALLITALFHPSAASLRSVPAIVAALWLLQAGQLSDDDENMDVFSMVSALGYQSVLQPTAWLGGSERLGRQWEVPDDHPAVTGTRPPPSALRCAVDEQLGLPTLSFIGGVVDMVALTVASTDGAGWPVLHDEQWDEGRLSSLGAEFREAVEEHLTISFEALGTQVLAEVGERYAGVGSMRMRGTEALRRRPIVRFGDAVVSTGFDSLIVATGTALRDVAGSLNCGHSTLGFMLEAVALDTLLELDGRHLVIPPAVIDAVVPRDKKSCDAIVVCDGHWLLVEVTTKTPTARERVGERRDLTRRCRDYHLKLDQAVATITYLNQIASRLNIAPPQRTSMIVVASDPLFPTVPLLSALSDVRPDRQPRFVVSVNELEELVRIGRGTNVPELVSLWQSKGQHASLGGSIAQMTRWVGREPRSPVEYWASRLLNQPGDAA